MSRDFNLYLKDILKASQRIADYVVDLDFETFAANDQVVDAVLFNLMTTGEAVKNIPESTRLASPEVAWREIARFRDLVVHHYFGIQLTIIWEIVQTHIPTLQKQIQALLEESN